MIGSLPDGSRLGQLVELVEPVPLAERDVGHAHSQVRRGDVEADVEVEPLGRA